MNTITLAVIAGVIGIAVTAAVFYTVWYLFEQWKKQQDAASDGKERQAMADAAGMLLLRWTIVDYAVLLLMAVGMLFLFVDVLGVIRNRASYPDYHYGYLLSGASFAFLGMVFMIARLAVVLRIARKPGLSAPNDGHEPDQAERAE